MNTIQYNTFSKAFWLGSQRSGRSHTTAAEQCHGWIHQWMYSDLSVSVASQEVEEHHVSSRRTHTKIKQLDPAEDVCWQQSGPLQCSCSSDGIHCGLVIHWPHPSLHSLKVRRPVNVYAAWQPDMKFGTMYKKLPHNPLNSFALMVPLVTLQSTVHKCTQHFFRHCTVWCLFSTP